MDIKDSAKLIEAFKKKPMRTIFALLVLIAFLSIVAFFNGFFGEKGKRVTIPSNEGMKTAQPSADQPHQSNEAKSQPITSQRTDGNQAPIVNVGPGGKSVTNYGSKSRQPSPPPEKSSSVTSVGQTGGITAQNVVINVEGKPKPRAITTEQKLKLAQFLPPPASFQIAAACRLMDNESCSYADKLMDVFRDLKWQVGPTNKSFLDDTRTDVAVAITEDVQIPIANRIMAALNEVGISTGNEPIRKDSIAGVQANTLYLIVGTRKQAPNE